MSGIFHLQWSIKPLSPPRALIGCAGCGVTRAFAPSGKARLNANGKRLDAWLIYKCLVCDQTWNRPIFERQPRSAVSTDMLDALQVNDPMVLEAMAFDLAGLRRHAPRIETSEGYEVERFALAPNAGWEVAEIRLSNPAGHDVRLDRLLAGELDLSRTAVEAWFDDGRISCDHHGKRALRRAAKDGARLWLMPGTVEHRDRLDRLFSGYPPSPVAS